VRAPPPSLTSETHTTQTQREGRLPNWTSPPNRPSTIPTLIGKAAPSTKQHECRRALGVLRLPHTTRCDSDIPCCAVSELGAASDCQGGECVMETTNYITSTYIRIERNITYIIINYRAGLDGGDDCFFL
jgi:hypothetical protein